MLDAAIQDFLAKGGTITKIPPGASEYGHSPHMGTPCLPPSSCLSEGVTIHAVIQQFFDAHKAKKEKRRRAINSYNAKAARDKADRLAEMAAALHRGVTVEQIAVNYGHSEKWTRALLREAGVDLPKPVFISNATKRASEVVAMYLAGSSVETVATMVEANARSVRAVLKEAGVKIRGPRWKREIENG